jgi:hypothetical protein
VVESRLELDYRKARQDSLGAVEIGSDAWTDRAYVSVPFGSCALAGGGFCGATGAGALGPMKGDYAATPSMPCPLAEKRADRSFRPYPRSLPLPITRSDAGSSGDTSPKEPILAQGVAAGIQRQPETLLAVPWPQTSFGKVEQTSSPFSANQRENPPMLRPACAKVHGNPVAVPTLNIPVQIVSPPPFPTACEANAVRGPARQTGRGKVGSYAILRIIAEIAAARPRLHRNVRL